MNSELEVLLDVVARLEDAGIDYMLTGSVAMSVYVEPRMTRDIDVVVALAGADAGRVVGLFSPEYYVDDEAVRSAVAARGMFNLFHLARLVKVDLIVPGDDDFQRHEFARRRRHDLGGRSVWVISKEDLILSKLAWAAPTESALQLRDVRKLVASGADEAYLAPGARSSASTRCCESAWMRDTTLEFERFVAAQYRRLTPAERVRLCTEMFDAARVLVESGLPPGLGDRERSWQITARFYGTEFANRVFSTGPESRARRASASTAPGDAAGRRRVVRLLR